jgi:hypothetical protein
LKSVRWDELRERLIVFYGSEKINALKHRRTSG